MHENGRTGIVTGTIEELAQICRCKPEDLSESLNDLKNSKTAFVTVRNKNVTVVNRRMRREHISRERAKLRVRRHRQKPDVTPLFAGSSVSSSVSIVSKSKSSSSSNGADPPLTDSTFSEAFFDQIQSEPESAGFDVRHVYGKFKDWVSKHGGDGDERHFIRWLKRERQSDAVSDGSEKQIERVLARMRGNN